jgi:hypothetical protein
LAECEKEEERVKQLRIYLPNLTFWSFFTFITDLIYCTKSFINTFPP